MKQAKQQVKHPTPSKRWMKWIVEAETDALTLPWSRDAARKARKDAARTRARAA